MGIFPSREQGQSPAKISNGKTINLLIQICSSWGYGSKADIVKSVLIQDLNSLGYNVQYIFEPQSGGNGEFYIFETTGQKRCLFANNRNLGDDKTIFGSTINKEISKRIADNINNFYWSKIKNIL